MFSENSRVAAALAFILLLGVIVIVTIFFAVSARIDTARAAEPTRGSKCGLDLVDDGSGGTLYLEPITGRKNISCADAQGVATAAREAKPNLYCAKKTRHAGWTIRHAGRYEESLSARFTKGNQRFRIQSQGSCK